MAIPENPITRKEHFLAKAAGQDVETPEPITREEMYLDVIAEGGGGGSGTDNRFIVTCTPTAADYSGTMDKTVAEIDEAWQAGKSIYFYVDGAGFFPLSVAGCGYMAYGISIPQNAIIVIATDDISNHHAYHTKIYQLTPMGG